MISLCQVNASAACLMLIALGAPFASVAAPAPPHPYDVTDTGALGDGETLNTAAIQQSIDRCSAEGGGTVCFPPGRYLTGTLVLKNNVHLHLDQGVVLLGSTEDKDYPAIVPKTRSYTDNYVVQSVLYTEGEENISIEGPGVIDGQGAAFRGRPFKERPYLVRFVGCRDVRMQDVTCRNASMWTLHFLACDVVRLSGLTIRSRGNQNNDGIDLDGCRNVRVSDCDISTLDDAIVLKSTLPRVCERVAVTNCVLSSDCAAFKLGTESNGGFRDIVFSNSVIYDTHISGISLLMVDGGILEKVAVNNITMDDVANPLFIRLGNRARPHIESAPKPGMGRLRNVVITNVQATGADNVGCAITGLPDHPVEGITLRDIRIESRGGGGADLVDRDVPEVPEAYPTHGMFMGPLPAFGIYVRHAASLLLDNLQLHTAEPDSRPSLLVEDARDVQIIGLRANAGRPMEAALLFRNVCGACVSAAALPPDTRALLSVEGPESGDIRLTTNRLAADTRQIVTAPEVQENAAVPDVVFPPPSIAVRKTR